MRIKHFFYLFLGCMFLCSCGAARLSVSETGSSASIIECIQITSNNDCIVSVQSTGKSIESAKADAAKDVVYRLLFEGLPGSSSNRIGAQAALVPDISIREKNNVYFDRFFSSKEYLSFIDPLVEDIPKVVKTNNKYRVTSKMVVKKEALRKKLEKDGIIKSLSNII